MKLKIHSTMKTLKILALVCSMFFIATISSNASDINRKVISISEPQKTEITPSELPDAVKDAIMEGEFAQWNIEKVYKIIYTDDENKIEYEVHFSNDENEKEIEVYNKEGEIIED